jgi:hypothetical protein
MVLNIMSFFLDASSRYTWLYLMTKKSDAFNIFLQFQKYVEHFLKLKLNPFNPAGEANIAPSQHFSKIVALFTVSPVLTLINNKAPLSANIVM